MLSDIDTKKGESECQYYIDKLEYLDDRQRDPLIERCKSLLCHGELRNKSGTVSTTHSAHYIKSLIPYKAVTLLTTCFAISNPTSDVNIHRRSLITLAVFVVSLQKLHVFLFTELLVLTRPVTRNERQCFQVYRQPIPVQDLVLEDLQDGDVRMGGSFRGAFSNADKGEACVSLKDV